MNAPHTPPVAEPAGRDGALTSVQRALQAHGMERALWTRECLEPRLMASALGVVLGGQLELRWHQGDAETAIAALGPGDWFGEHTLLSVTAAAPLSLRARTLARLVIIPAEPLQARLAHELASLRAPLYAELAGSLARRWLDLAVHLHQARHLGTDAQLLGALHEAATWPSALSHPEGTLVAVARKQLAQRIGCSRVSVSRALSRLAAAGHVRLEGRRILLLGHQGRGGTV